MHSRFADQLHRMNRSADCKIVKYLNARCNSFVWLLISWILVFWDVILHGFVMGLELLKVETLLFFKILETTCPVLRCDIPGDQSSQLNHHENLKTCIVISCLF